MKLENQVVSIEYAKRLKRFGVSQDSFFHWIKDGEGLPYYVAQVVKEDWEPYIFSAFTVAELGELISTVKGIRLDSTRHTTMDEWSIAISETEKIYADTEADARAKMLIYLLENNIINQQV